MALHHEIEFENDICDHLAANGWLYSADDEAQNYKGYDRATALFRGDLIAWVKETQPESWAALEKSHGGGSGGDSGGGGKAGDELCRWLRKALDAEAGGGTLEVLRNGFEVLGLKSAVSVAQFRPALSINPELEKKYAANRLRVVRQVRYSRHNENSIDLVLFVNGLPVATAELKTDFTQAVENAVDQYRLDRLPQTKGKPPEPLLSFPGGALVHFAVSGSKVRMTTKLAGPATFFLPFDRGDGGAAGNPSNPKGYATSYLWEEVWERESWLDILGRYIVAEKDKKKKLTKVIFPRYHQLDATRKLQAAVLKDGPGGKYLIQHSAGSGKTNSIAWTAHFLSDLHAPAPGSGSGSQGKPEKIFDSVLVVSDRNVIDGQLQDAIAAFERTSGVVATITGDGGSKSGALAEALGGTKKVVVCTIQTFPFALEAVRELSATQGKRFCVIADEAHSSQTGEAAAKLKQVLTEAELEAVEDGAEVSSEDVLAAQMAAKASEDGVTYIAFTATPKAKTLELFGNRPDPTKPAGEGNLPVAFHVYSMRQAIEEEFILDVLQNYTTYKLAFRLAEEAKDAAGGASQTEIEKAAAMKKLMGWVRLHPYNIAQKVQIVVEHYRDLVAPLLGGKAKAMVVVSSRLEAVRWQLAIEKYIQSQGYAMKTLVAFSGEVDDKDSGPEPFKETSTTLNPGLKGRDIREAFKDETYQILLVANKFQTGFDQPLLCAMYVDKRLAGIQAVQTLSRLNRCYPGKDTTYVLDFVNESGEVLEAFKAYYTTAELADVTDRGLVLELRTKLDATGYYDQFEVDRVVEVVIDPQSKQKQLEAAIKPVADRLLKQFAAAQEAFKAATALKDDKAAQDTKDTMDALLLFRGDAGTYLRVYTFLSQVFDYQNTEFEKRAIFFKHLIKLLKFGREREGVDLSQVVLTHHTIKNLGKQPMDLGGEEYPKLNPITAAGSGEVREKEKAFLNEIIEKLNDLFTSEISDRDQLVFAREHVLGAMLESEVLVKQAASNSKEQFANSPDFPKEFVNAVINSMDAQQELSTQALNSSQVQAGLMQLLMGPLKLYESLRERAAG